MSLIRSRSQFYYQSNQIKSGSSNSLDSREIVNRSKSVTFKDQPPIHNHRNRNLSLTERTKFVELEHHPQHSYHDKENQSSECLRELTTSNQFNRYPIHPNHKQHKRKSQSISNLNLNNLKPILIIPSSLPSLPFDNQTNNTLSDLPSVHHRPLPSLSLPHSFKSLEILQSNHTQNEVSIQLESYSIQPNHQDTKHLTSNHQINSDPNIINPISPTHSKSLQSSDSSHHSMLLHSSHSKSKSKSKSQSTSKSDHQPKSNTSSNSSNSNSNQSIISSPPSSLTTSSNNLPIEFPIRLDTRFELISILDSLLGSHRLSTLVNLDQLRIQPNESPTITTHSPHLSIQSSKPSTSDSSQSKGLLKRLGWRTRAITLASIRPSTSNSTEDSLSTQHDSIRSFRLFGVPLSETACASCVTIIGGQKHRLPILVFKTVEQIYTRGLGTTGLFRTKGNPIRIESLIKAFETPPSYGDLVALDREELFDLCDLLKSFLWSLPQPLLEPDLSELFWTTCVDEEGPEKLPIATRVTIAQVIFRLLPTRAFSLLVYLIAFLSQIPLFPGNQLSLQMISQIFGPALLAPRKVATVGLGIDHHSSFSGSNIPKEILNRAVNGLTWLQSNWNQITDGLLDERIRCPPSQPSIPIVPTSPRALTIVEEASFECDSEGQAETEAENRITSDKMTESQHEIETESTIGLATSPDTRFDPSFDSRHPTKIPYALPHHSTARRSISLPRRHHALSPSVTLQLRKANKSSRSLCVSSPAKKPLDSRPTSCSEPLIDYPHSTVRMSCGNLSRHLDPNLSIAPESHKIIDPPRSLSASSTTQKYSDSRPISISQSLSDYTQSKASKSFSDVCYHPEGRSSVKTEQSETLALPRSVSVSSVHKFSDTARFSCSRSLSEDFGKTESSPASHFRRDSETSNASITLSSASASSTSMTPIHSNLTGPRQDRLPLKVLEAQNEPVFVTPPPAIHTSQSTAIASFGSSKSNAQSIVDQYEAHGPDQLRKIIDSFKGQEPRERRVSTYTARCESCTPVLPEDLKRYNLGPTSTASDFLNLCSCPINIRPRTPISTRTKRASPTLLTRKTTQSAKRNGVTEAVTSEEDPDPILALSEMMRSKNGMIRAQAETIKAQAELLVESENRLAAAQSAHNHNEEIDQYFIPLFTTFESLNQENRKRCEMNLNRIRFVWENERKQYEEESVKLKEKLLNTLQDYEKVSDQLSVIRRAIGEEVNKIDGIRSGQSSSSSSL